jgi:hypothetical protein
MFACSEEGFIEPPSKKAKASPNKPTPAASETPAPPKVAPAPSSLSKGKEVPSAAVASPSPRGELVSISSFLFLGNGSLSSSPGVYVRLIAIEYGLETFFNVSIMMFGLCFLIGYPNCRNNYKVLRLPILFAPR